MIAQAVANFLLARMDSSEAKIRAEVAYEAQSTNVKELQSAVKDLQLNNARLQGQIDSRWTRASPLERARVAVPLKAPLQFEEAVTDYKNAQKQ